MKMENLILSKQSGFDTDHLILLVSGKGKIIVVPNLVFQNPIL